MLTRPDSSRRNAAQLRPHPLTSCTRHSAGRRLTTARGIRSCRACMPLMTSVGTAGPCSRAAGAGSRTTGIYSNVQTFRMQNNLRPYSAYNIPVTNPIPGPDGVVPAGNPYGTMTYYEFSPAYQGRAFQQPMLVNDANATQTYKSFEVA